MRPNVLSHTQFDLFVVSLTHTCFLYLCPPLIIFLCRILANHTTYTKDKQRFLLDGVSKMQLAVTEQEHVVLNAQSLLISQEEVSKVRACSKKIHLSL